MVGLLNVIDQGAPVERAILEDRECNVVREGEGSSPMVGQPLVW
jgi:hypothetical protein